MRKALVAAALGVSFLLTPAWSGADIYSYVDRDGTMHFTNAPAGDGRYRLYMRSKDSARRRTANAASAAPADASPERFTRYNDVIREAAALYQIPEELVRAVIKVESDYEPRAISRVGAQGLMQLMPETAERMQVRDILDPRENILGGVRYLRILANMFNGDLELTLAGYNAGEYAVMHYGGIPPYEETQQYVARVLAYYRRYRDVRDTMPAGAVASE
jgi:soluble lytic murein transglycosylase-like protein